MNITYLEPVASDELEGELAELPEVVPGQLPLLVVEGERLGGHDPVRGRALVLEPEHVFLDLRVAEGFTDSSSVRPEEIVRHVGMEVEIVVIPHKVSRL